MHRDSPGPEPEAEDAINRVDQPHRFRRLVESSTTRRVALPRLALAIAVGLSAVGFVVFVAIATARWMMSYVADLPDQQTPFTKIELNPEPPPWILGRKDRIIDQVQKAMKRGEQIRRLEPDLPALKNAFLLGSPWWVKRVNRIVVQPDGLTVSLEYRKPVAVVELDRPGDNSFAIDEEGVPIRTDEIDWISKQPPYQVIGIAEPLIRIVNVDKRSKPSFGVPWKCVTESGEVGEPDQLVIKAARLAEFIERQPKATTSGRPGPNLIQILPPEGPSHAFFLKDRDQTLICWGKPPGDEALGEPSAEIRWKRLLRWYDQRSPGEARSPDFLWFTKDGVAIFRPKPRQN